MTEIVLKVNRSLLFFLLTILNGAGTVVTVLLNTYVKDPGVATTLAAFLVVVINAAIVYLTTELNNTPASQ